MIAVGSRQAGGATYIVGLQLLCTVRSMSRVAMVACCPASLLVCCTPSVSYPTALVLRACGVLLFRSLRLNQVTHVCCVDAVLSVSALGDSCLAAMICMVVSATTNSTAAIVQSSVAAVSPSSTGCTAWEPNICSRAVSPLTPCCCTAPEKALMGMLAQARTVRRHSCWR
ncbi:hypothetical protein COO60DRAFT_723082 [Scenedesmus sp. NREL 46B-D3]|nr:hypothetical protein COO60DRAFT_723082 [Scenedesmus sp. NREL 46B-D3]